MLLCSRPTKLTDYCLHWSLPYTHTHTHTHTTLESCLHTGPLHKKTNCPLYWAVRWCACGIIVSLIKEATLIVKPLLHGPAGQGNLQEPFCTLMTLSVDPFSHHRHPEKPATHHSTVATLEGDEPSKAYRATFKNASLTFNLYLFLSPCLFP